jgi:hypothetical protein
MGGKGFGEVQAKGREDLTEEQQNKAQECDRNGWRNAQVGHLAEPAAWFIMPAVMGVRHDLQQKEERNQREGEGNTRSQPATSLDIC